MLVRRQLQGNVRRDRSLHGSLLCGHALVPVPLLPGEPDRREHRTGGEGSAGHEGERRQELRCEYDEWWLRADVIHSRTEGNEYQVFWVLSSPGSDLLCERG